MSKSNKSGKPGSLEQHRHWFMRDQGHKATNARTAKLLPAGTRNSPVSKPMPRLRRNRTNSRPLSPVLTWLQFLWLHRCNLTAHPAARGQFSLSFFLLIRCLITSDYEGDKVNCLHDYYYYIRVVYKYNKQLLGFHPRTTRIGGEREVNKDRLRLG